MNVGILAGGKSSRYGKNKILEKIDGKTFIEKIYCEFKDCNVIISTDGSNYGLDAKYIYDENTQIGPIEGIRRILEESEDDYTAIVSGDTPLIKKELYEYISTYICGDYEVYVAVSGGRIHPLCGIYKKTVLPEIERAVQEGRYSVTGLIKNLRTKYIDLKYSPAFVKCLVNINKPEDKIKISRNVIAISGQKNSGKTTLICNILPYIKKYIEDIIIIKHDGHDFEIDRENTDTYKYKKAGADDIVIMSDKKTVFMQYNRKNDIEKIIENCKDYSLIILEGFKNSDYPKIEVFRKGRGESPVCNKNVIAVATDVQNLELNCTKLNINEPENIAGFIIDYLGLI